MMDVRRTMRGLVLLLIVIILVSPVMENSAGMKSEKMMQPQSPDVTITNLTFSENEPGEGENITIFVTLKNNESEVIDGLTIRLMRFDKNITKKQISIEGENETTLEFEWKAVGGRQTITAVLSMKILNSDESIPLDDMSREIWVEPEPLGDIYSPLLALGFIFVVVFGSVLIPSIIASLTDKSSTRKRK